MKPGHFGRHLLLLVAVLVTISPLLFMAMTSLKSDNEYASNRVGPPHHPTFQNISTVIHDPNLTQWFLNSIIITTGAVLLSVVAGVLAAYPMARCGGWWPKGLLPGVILLLAIPPVVLVVPLFIMMVNLHLLNSRVGVILTYAGLLTPLTIYLLVGFIRGIPPALDEAASIDGAGRTRVLLYVLLPLMRPALVTVSVVGAVFVWNEFLIALLFLQSEHSQTIMVGIAALQGRYGINEPLLMAWSLIASLPVIVAYIFGQRFFVRGLVAGALEVTGLVIRGVRDLDGSVRDLCVAGAEIAATPVEGAEILDGAGWLALPRIADIHVHLDKTLLGEPWIPHYPTDQLSERARTEQELLESDRVAPLDVRATRLVRQAAGHGTTLMQSHVDVADSGGVGRVETLLQVAAEHVEIMDIALVAFPQQGIVKNRQAEASLDAALSLGAEAIGGLDPATFDGDRAGQLDVIFALAERHGCRVDIHLHEPAETGTATMRAIAERAATLGLTGRCAVSHGYALAQVDDLELGLTAEAMAAAGVSLVTSVPGDGRLPPLDRLRELGVNVAVVSDNIRDSWSPFGNADQLSRAALAAYCSNWRSDAQLAEALPLVTSNPAKAVGRSSGLLQPGDPADFTLVAAENLGAALTSLPTERTVVRGGKVITSTDVPVRS